MKSEKQYRANFSSTVSTWWNKIQPTGWQDGNRLHLRFGAVRFSWSEQWKTETYFKTELRL